MVKEQFKSYEKGKNKETFRPNFINGFAAIFFCDSTNNKD